MTIRVPPRPFLFFVRPAAWIAAAALTAGSSQAESLFPNQVFPAGISPRGIARGDFDRDGHADLALADVSQDFVSLLRGHGDGTFDAPTHLPSGRNPYRVVVADLNHDGLDDLVVANSALFDDQATGDVTIWLGAANGSFTGPTHLTVGDHPNDVAVADLDGDGILDIATANNKTNDVSVRLGLGNGDFAPDVRFPAGTNPFAIAVGDVNGDRTPDIVVANFNSFDVSIFLGTGGGQFGPPLSVPAAINPVSVAIGDLDRDGVPDLVVRDGEKAVVVLLGLGDGQFAPGVRYDTGLGYARIAISDLNADGILDVIAPIDSSGQFSVFLGVGDGTLAPQVRYTAGNSPSDAVLGDFNEDGVTDLAIANGAGDVSIKIGRGDGTFDTVPTYPVGAYPNALALADFDGDGRLDVASANFDSSDVSVLPGLGDGRFKQEIRSTGTSGRPFAIASADLNRDGHPDVAVAQWYTDDVAILPGVGDGSFGDPVRYAVGVQPYALLLEDVSGDGIEDLVTANGASGDLSVRRGAGDGGFGSETRFPAGPWPFSVATGDFNGDGLRDVAVALYGDGGEDEGGAAILLGSGNGSFGPARRFAAGILPHSVAIGDFNRDGRDDVAVVSWGADHGDASVAILLGLGDGTFAPQTRFAVGDLPQSLVVADLNGDGLLDLAVGHSVVSILLGRGDGTFEPEIRFEAGDGLSGIATADMDGDERRDLVVTNTSNPGAVGILLNRGAIVTHPPVANAGADIVVRCTPGGRRLVSLDGSGSTDADSTPGTNDDIVTFEWFEDYSLPTQRLLGTGEKLGVEAVCARRSPPTTGVALTAGSHRLTLKVSDSTGRSDTDEIQVQVVHTTRSSAATRQSRTPHPGSNSGKRAAPSQTWKLPGPPSPQNHAW